MALSTCVRPGVAPPPLDLKHFARSERAKRALRFYRGVDVVRYIASLRGGPTISSIFIVLAMAFRRKFIARRRRGVGRRAWRPRTKVLRVTAARAVRNLKRKVNRMAPESKNRELFNYNRDLYSFDNGSGPFAAGNVIPINFSSGSLNIQQGTGNGQRVGNRLHVKSLTFKGTLSPYPYDALSNPTPKPMQVNMWFFYQRDAPASIPTNPQNDFFESNSATAALRGDLTDLWSPINTDKYRLLGKRTFKLGHAASWLPANVGQVTNNTFYNNDFKLNCNFSVNIAKMIPKLVRYIDNNVDASSRGVYVMIEPVWADGTVAPSSTLMARMDYMIVGKYTDN